MNIQDVCNSVDTVKKLVMLNNCFSVKAQEVIMAQLCCLGKLSLPMDGFDRISTPVLPGGYYTVFDNGLDVSPLTAKMQTRGFILCFSYPQLDADGLTLDDTDKDMVAYLYDNSGNNLAIPVCKSFIILGNPAVSDTSKVLNKLVLYNPGNFTLNVEGLLLLVNSEGMVLPQDMTTCC